MPAQFLFDEDSLDESLRNAIRQHNETSPDEVLDVKYIDGTDPTCPARHSDDNTVIRWAAEHNRVIVSKDTNTLIGYHRDFVRQGNTTPGLLILRGRREGTEIKTHQIVESLIEIAYYLDPSLYNSCHNFIPR